MSKLLKTLTANIKIFDDKIEISGVDFSNLFSLKQSSLIENISSKSIKDIKLNTGVRNALMRAGINTVDEFLEKEIEQLVHIRGFGPKGFFETRCSIQNFSGKDYLKIHNLTIEDVKKCFNKR